MRVTHNPFGRPADEKVDHETNFTHPSDDPGYETDVVHDHRTQHATSGTSAGSQPRRPGTGERQAPTRFSDKQVVAYEGVIPGEVLYGSEDVEINAGAQETVLRVENTADRPVQVGSHFHFAEVNAALSFDRDAAWGKRLNILAGGSMRFEPGAVQEAHLIPIGGDRVVRGLRGKCGGKLDG